MNITQIQPLYLQLKQLTDASPKTDKNDEKITEISSKLSDYEDRLNKLSINDIQIHPLFLHITKLKDTSFKTDKHEKQLTSITPKFRAYENLIDKQSTASTNKTDTEMIEHEEKMNT